MQTHVRVLAILHLVFGGLGIVVAILLLAVFGGVAGIVSVNAPHDDALVAIPILGGVGAVIVLMVALLSVPSIIAGAGLLSYKPWSRILTLVLSVLLLVNVPFGTALGFYGFWVLLSKDVIPLFERNPPHMYSRPGA
jgi:hypothetical protein